VSPVSQAGWVSCFKDFRCAVQVEQSIISTISAVFIEVFYNISTRAIAREPSLGSVLVAIGVVLELNKIRTNVEAKANLFLGCLDLDIIRKLVASENLDKSFIDWVEGIVLVGHPALLVRILVPQLLEATILTPIGNVFSSITHVNSVVSSRCRGFEGLISELRVAKATKVVHRLGVGFYAGSRPLGLASYFSLLASCLEKAIAEFIRGSAVLAIDVHTVFFSFLAFHPFESCLAGLFSTSMGGTRRVVQFEAFTFIC